MPEVTHEFQSAKGDGPDASMVRPSDWNAIHQFHVTGPAIVGRHEAGAGVAVDIPLGPGLAFTGGALQASIREMPIGTVVDFVGLAEPAGWLFCFGQQLSRDVYSGLFAVIGTSYGVGDGATTFNIPDCRGRVRAGKDNMGGTAANRIVQTVDGKTLGNVVGGEKHVLSMSHLPAQPLTGTTSTQAAHRHLNVIQGDQASGSPEINSGESIVSINSASLSYRLNGTSSEPDVGRSGEAGAHSHTFTTANLGLAEGHLNMQPTIITNTIIYYGVTS